MFGITLDPQVFIYILFISFSILAIIGIPIAFALGLSSILVILLEPRLTMWVFFQRSFYALDSFILLAVPLFLFTGTLMNSSRITDKLIVFARNLIGHIKGGLAHVNIIVSMLFAGISGSTNADAAGIGSVLIPAMKKEGYPISISVAVTAASSVMGVIIPPSILMVVWSAITETSIAGLFLGGIIPGILIGLGQMLLVGIIAQKKNFPRTPRPRFRELLSNSKHGLIAMGAPVLIIGGLIMGAFTPTEAAVAGTIYCLFISIIVYRELIFSNFLKACWETARLSSLALFCVAMASIYGWLISYYRIPQLLMKNILIENPIQLLLFTSVVMIFFGTFMDSLPSMAILGPLFLPLMEKAGIHPVHFGVVSVMSLALGFITPPYGLSLLISSKIGGIPMTKALKDTMLFFLVMVVILVLIIVFPNLVLFLPQRLAPQFL